MAPEDAHHHHHLLERVVFTFQSQNRIRCLYLPWASRCHHAQHSQQSARRPAPLFSAQGAGQLSTPRLSPSLLAAEQELGLKERARLSSPVRQASGLGLGWISWGNQGTEPFSPSFLWLVQGAVLTALKVCVPRDRWVPLTVTEIGGHQGDVPSALPGLSLSPQPCCFQGNYCCLPPPMLTGPQSLHQSRPTGPMG